MHDSGRDPPRDSEWPSHLTGTDSKVLRDFRRRHPETHGAEKQDPIPPVAPDPGPTDQVEQCSGIGYKSSISVHLTNIADARNITGEVCQDCGTDLYLIKFSLNSNPLVIVCPGDLTRRFNIAKSKWPVYVPEDDDNERDFGPTSEELARPLLDPKRGCSSARNRKNKAEQRKQRLKDKVPKGARNRRKRNRDR